MLEMREVSKVYRTETVETHALRGFSLKVDEGEFVAVTGPSGSGKTTFLTIAGLLEDFTRGEYLLDGVNVHGMNDNQRSRLRNEKIGFVFQAFNLIPDLNVLDNVEVPLHYRHMSGGERRKRALAALERVGCRRVSSTTRPSFPAASSSAWPSRARWPAARACCSPTSPPATSIPPWRAG
ncbi:ABC transporter, ATP-binding protein [mine drainage metagenome]|uniref:ABC transporter, ATP-binding protein n=1 Tax=mine drainage metagenome TaxID=410659 RepID=T1AXX2_9ZZZZ